MSVRHLLFTAPFVLASVAKAQEAPRLLHTPAIHGDTIVFTFDGDLWTARKNSSAEAKRLTDKYGNESRPFFSPDGKWIAFTADTHGPEQVYVMPAGGGEAKRLSFSNRALTVGWTPDGRVAYRSAEGNFTTRQERLWFVPKEGGLPTRTPLTEFSDGALMPDGKTLVYTRANSYVANWRGYRGGRYGRISFFDLSNNSYRELPTGDEMNYFPMPVGKSIYYISDLTDRTFNLWRYDQDSKRKTQLTKFADADVRFPYTDGKSVVWERDGYLELYDIASGEVTKQTPKLPLGELKPVEKNLSKNLGIFALSPGGETIYASARGDLLSIPVGTGQTQNLTKTSGVREKIPQLSPDGKKLAYIGDESGEWEIYVLPTGGGPAKRVTNSNGKLHFWSLGWAPNSRLMELRTLDSHVYLLDTETGELTHVVRLVNIEMASNFSPDSKWLGFVNQDAKAFGKVHLYDIGARKLTQVSEGYYSDDDLSFDLNGNYLYILSTRQFFPGRGKYEYSLNVQDSDRIYAVPLRTSTPDPTFGERAEVPQPAKDVRVDLEDLGERLVPVVPVGNYSGIVGTRDGFFYTSTSKDGKSSYMRYDLARREVQTIIENSTGFTQLDPTHSKLAVYRGGEMRVVPVEPKVKLDGPMVDLSGAKVTVNPAEEWRQMFWDAWRFHRDNHYDPNLKGRDWKAIGKRYEAYLPWVRNRFELNHIFGLMVGELGSSHSYITAPGDLGPPPKSIPVGQLGADYEGEGQFVKFKKVYYGSAFEEGRRGPLGGTSKKVRDGEYLLAIDGQPVTTAIHPNSLLLDRAGKIVTLLVNTRPTKDGAREVKVQPIGNESQLRYREWVEENRRYVAKASGGRIGYMHIPNELHDGAAEYIRGFFGQAEKEAMLVDERWNAGGYLQTWYVDTLNRRQLFRMSSRNSAEAFDSHAIEGPKALLINEHAGSGGDSFPFMFRKAGTGPLIGRRTMGALTGINYELQLSDYGRLSSPDSAHYDPLTGKSLGENHGTAPDIEVDARPDLIARGIDPQLEAGIKYLMGELKKYKPRVTPKGFPIMPENAKR